MSILRHWLPGRRGWVVGDTAVNGSRVAITHVETHHTFWAFGSSHEERLEDAGRQIDELHTLRWTALATLIEEDDHAGPHVRLIGSPDAVGAATP